MDWPTQSVESIPGEGFQPPHCPWAACRSHREGGFDFKRCGRFVRKQDGRVVPRFVCTCCRRSFSLQSFAFSYYLKRAELSVPIAAQLQAGSAHRQIARTLGCAASTVTRRAARLGRHGLLLLEHSLDALPPLAEPVGYDDFETFAHSQDQPVGVGTLVGATSWFVYGVEAAAHGRRGRTSPIQKERLARRKLPRYGDSSAQAFGRTLDRLVALAPEGSSIRVITDDSPAYARALRRHPQRVRVEHRVHPNPPRGPKGSPRSLLARARDEAMFPIDLLHLIVRHTHAHHRRETIAFARRHNALMERTLLLAVWRNFVKRRSERTSTSPTPAMSVGLTEHPWSWPRVLAKRLFPWRERVSPSWMHLYRRAWITPAMGPNTTHDLVHAF